MRRHFGCGMLLGVILCFISPAFAADPAPLAAPAVAPATPPAEAAPAAAPAAPPAEAAPAAAPAALETAKVEASAKADPTKDWIYRLLADESLRLRFARQVKLEGESKSKNFDSQDLRLRFAFDMEDPSRHWAVDWSLALFWDLEGRPSTGSNSPLSTMTERPQSDAWFSLYTLQAEYHSRDLLRLARIGRQSSDYGRALTYDGATLVFAPLGRMLELVAFGGHLMRFYAPDMPFFGAAGDWLASGGVVVRPTDYLRFDVLYRFTKEDGDTRSDPKDHSVSVAARGRWLDYLFAKAYLETLNKNVSETGGSLRGEWVEGELGAQLAVKAQPVTLHRASDWADPFSLTLNRSLPFVQINSEIWKAFTTKVGVYGLHLGYDARQLLNGHKEESFNRNTGRLYLSAGGTDIGVKGPFAQVVFERVADGPAISSHGQWMAGGSVGYDHKYVRAEVGSVYQQYKYDYFADANELAKVETVYAEIKGKPLKWLALRARYECDIMKSLVLHSVFFGLTQSY